MFHKKWRWIAPFSAMAMVAAVTYSCSAQPGGGGPSYGGSVPSSKNIVNGIAWYGVLQDGLDEARRTGKPIMLLSAAPQCAGVPGMW